MGGIQRTAERASKALTRLEEKAERPSVLNAMREQAAKKDPEKEAPVPIQKQPER